MRNVPPVPDSAVSGPASGVLGLFEGDPSPADGWAGLRARVIGLRPGLAVGLFTGNGHGDVRASVRNNSPYIHFSCLLQDTSQAEVRGRVVVPCVGDGHVLYAPGEHVCARYGAHYRHVDLMVTPDALADLAGDECAGLMGAVCGGFVMEGCRFGDGAIGTAVELARRIGAPETHRLSLYGAALDYLASHCSSLNAGGMPGEGLPDRECRRLLAARERLLQDLSAPPTIAELAREIGLNQLKLKRGFKAMFGTSVYALFQQHRMERARRLLRRHSVTETALMLGYSNLSHFSTAFRKHFGVLPRDERKGPAV